MKIPNYYIEELRDISKRIDELDARELFLAYKKLLFIGDMFEACGVSGKDPIYERWFLTKEHVDLLLIGKLAEYEVLKMRVESYASKP